MYGEKIKLFRTIRGYSQQEMAEKLSVAQNTYSRYENNAANMSTEMLEKIAETLGVTIADLTCSNPIIIQNQTPNTGTQIGYNGALYLGQKELFEKVITSKDEEIGHLKDIIAGLLKDKEMMMQILGKK